MTPIEIAILAGVVVSVVVVSAFLTGLIIRFLNLREEGTTQEVETLDTREEAPVKKRRSQVNKPGVSKKPKVESLTSSQFDTPTTRAQSKRKSSKVPAAPLDPLSSDEPTALQYQIAADAVAMDIKTNPGTETQPNNFSVWTATESITQGEQVIMISYAGLITAQNECTAAYKAALKPVIAQYKAAALTAKAAELGVPEAELTLTTAEKQAAQVAAEQSLAHSAEKQAQNLAQKRVGAFLSRFTKAYTAAAHQHKDAFLSINGFCGKRIKDVGGLHNNCGLNVLLHSFIEHWDEVDFQEDTAAHALFVALRTKADLANTATPAQLKTHLDTLDFRSQEMLFGDVVRKQLADTFLASEGYYENWLITELGGHTPPAAPAQPNASASKALRTQYTKDFAQWKTDKEAWKKSVWAKDMRDNPILCSLPEYKRYFQFRCLSTKAEEALSPELKAEKLALEKTLFTQYYTALGNPARSMMTSLDEIYNYGAMLGFQLNNYAVDPGNPFRPLTLPDPQRPGAIQVNIRLINNNHWQYESKSKAKYLALEPAEPKRKAPTGGISSAGFFSFPVFPPKKAAAPPTGANLPPKKKPAVQTLAVEPPVGGSVPPPVVPPPKEATPPLAQTAPVETPEPPPLPPRPPGSAQPTVTVSSDMPPGKTPPPPPPPLPKPPAGEPPSGDTQAKNRKGKSG